MPNLLLAKDEADPNLVCALTKALFDRKPQLEQANAAAKGIPLDTPARRTRSLCRSDLIREMSDTRSQIGGRRNVAVVTSGRFRSSQAFAAPGATTFLARC